VLKLEGGNEYKEGRAAYVRSFKGLRIKGKLSPHAYLNTQFSIDGQEVSNVDVIDEEYEDI
jgi:hypothetical protein